MSELTKEQAVAIMGAHDIYNALEHEYSELEENDPGLLDAYCALHRIAHGSKEDELPPRADR